MELFAGALSSSLAAFWMVAVVVFLVVEGAAPGLVSIWFAVGALAALISALFGAPLWLQIVWFLLVSILALALTRPLARKYVNGKSVPTNADMLIGKDCVVVEDIDNVRGSGAVSVSGQIWSARTLHDEDRPQAGELLRVLRIEGVKLIVGRAQEKTEETTD